MKSFFIKAFDYILATVALYWFIFSFICSYMYENEKGIFPETQFVFDLEMPESFQPVNIDGEVEAFYLLTIEEVNEIDFINVFMSEQIVETILERLPLTFYSRDPSTTYKCSVSFFKKPLLIISLKLFPVTHPSLCREL